MKIALQRLPKKAKKEASETVSTTEPERRSERLLLDDTDETMDDYAIALSMCEDIYEPTSDEEW